MYAFPNEKQVWNRVTEQSALFFSYPRKSDYAWYSSLGSCSTPTRPLETLAHLYLLHLLLSLPSAYFDFLFPFIFSLFYFLFPFSFSFSFFFPLKFCDIMENDRQRYISSMIYSKLNVYIGLRNPSKLIRNSFRIYIQSDRNSTLSQLISTGLELTSNDISLKKKEKKNVVLLSR